MPAPALSSSWRLLAVVALLPACGLIPGFGESAEGAGGADPGAGGGGAGGEEPEVIVCTVETVDDRAACGEACDAVVDGQDGRSMCTTTCDVDAQDCDGDRFRCETDDDGRGACYLDCGSHACPDDYACDQDVELCVPVAPG